MLAPAGQVLRIFDNNIKQLIILKTIKTLKNIKLEFHFFAALAYFQ